MQESKKKRNHVSRLCLDCLFGRDRSQHVLKHQRGTWYLKYKKISTCHDLELRLLQDSQHPGPEGTITYELAPTSSRLYKECNSTALTLAWRHGLELLYWRGKKAKHDMIWHINTTLRWSLFKELKTDKFSTICLCNMVLLLIQLL